MSEYFPTEGTRAASFRDLFKKHLNIDLRCVELSALDYKNNKLRTDGTLFEGIFIMMNAEVKLEPCISASNPYIQNIAYYKEYLIKNITIAETTRLPCFLAIISGPLFSISTTIYGEKVTGIHTHTFFFSIALRTIVRISPMSKECIEGL